MKIKLILPAIVFLSLFFCAGAHAAGPWRGVVIDAETKEPLEGAVVLAVWDRNYRTPTGGNSYFYEAKETLTNTEGYFEIPAYITINVLPIISYIEGPEFIIFKPGYGSYPRLSHLSIYAIEPLEIPYDELGKMITANGDVIEYAVNKKKKYSQGLIYIGEGCKERMDAVKKTTPFTIDFFYITMEHAGTKIEELDVPLDCPKDSEPVPHVERHEGEIDDSVRNRSFRIVELPRLKTKEERLSGVLYGFILPSHMPDYKMTKLLELRYKEEAELGLNPPKLNGGKK